MLVGVSTTYEMQENYERVNREYLDALANAGFTPVLVAPSGSGRRDVARLCERLDAFVLTGGPDMGLPETRQRDVFEMELARTARHHGIPLLGICRGMQVMNVAFGGNLIEDLPSRRLSGQATHMTERQSHGNAVAEKYAGDSPIEHLQSGPYNALTHTIAICPDSLLASIMGESAKVNSLHHQAVNELGTGIEACAFAPDGVVEALEAKTGEFFLGIQWHPEYLDEGVALFAALHWAAMRRRERQ